MSARCSAEAAATAAATGAVLGLGVARHVPTRGVAQRRSATMTNATILWHNLSQRECVGKSDQVCTTILKARETDVQVCNSVKST